MKKRNVFRLGVLALAAMGTLACHNSEQEFADYDYTAVYFAYQSPVRTIVIGEDVYDTTLDNEHKFMIYAVMGGCYSNDSKVTIDVTVDDALCTDLYFDDGSPVLPLPTSYYSMEADQIILNKSLNGGVVVSLTDDFFADPLAISNNYVLPLRMTDVSGADKILAGEAAVDDPNRFDSGDWNVDPMDYTLYCVKYINLWHASYLRRGVDQITIGGQTSEVVREEEYVEYDEVCYITTKSYTEALFPVEITTAAGESVTCELILSFDEDNKCTISTQSDGFVASGSGEYKVDGEIASWGNVDRDALYLTYQIDYNSSEVVYNTTDTLVVRDRGISLETFNVNYEPTN